MCGSRLEGNLCRCTGYQNIVKSILDAAGSMAGVEAWKGATMATTETFIGQPVLRKEDPSS